MDKTLGSLRALAVVALVLSTLAGGAPAAERKTLRVAGDQSYPPLAYLDEGTPRGFDVDVVKALAQAINRTVQIELSPWIRAQNQVLQLQSDCLIGMSVTEDRRKLWDFSTPTLTHSFSLFVTSGEVAIHGVDDLQGRRVGVTAGGFPREFLESKPGIRLALISNYEEGFALLRKGEVDAVAADTWVGGYTLNKHRIDGVAAAGPPFATLDSAIAVPKGQQAVLREINAGLAMLKSQGVLDEIRGKWEPKQVVYLLKEQVTRFTLLALAIGGTLLFAAMLGWVLTMKREIRVRKGVEDELRTSEQKFRVLVEHAPEAILVYDMDAARIVDANANAERLFGRSRAQLLQLGPEQLHSPAALGATPPAPSVEEATGRALGGEQVVFERSVRNSSTGEDTLCEVRLVRLPSDRAKLIRASCVDISGRKRAQEALKASEEKFRTAFMALPDAIVINAYPDETIAEVNEGFERIFGYSRGEAIGSTALKLGLFFDPADREKLIAEFEAHGRVINYEVRGRRKNGEAFFGLLSSNIASIDGTNFAVHVARDVTEYRRAEEALRIRQAKIESIFRGAPVGIGELVDRVFTVVNDRLCAMLGYSAEELVGRNTRMLYLSDSDWEVIGREGYARALAEGHSSAETRFRRRDGRVIDVLISLSPIVPGDLAAGATVTVMDITERKLAARELEDAFGRLKLISGQLLNAQEIERRAIANELHDEIGQALTAVTLKLHVLGKRISDGTASAADVQSCMSIADTALKQVRDLSLDLRPPQLDLMGLEAALRGLLATRTEGAALEAHFGAQLLPHGRDPQIDITCFRIVQEALTNVIRHARAANIWVKATQANGEIELHIRDDGCGFDADAAMARAANGSSVGLLSMEERAVLSGGSFELLSRPGAGTTIRASIPLDRDKLVGPSGTGAVQ